MGRVSPSQRKLYTHTATCGRCEQCERPLPAQMGRDQSTDDGTEDWSEKGHRLEDVHCLRALGGRVDVADHRGSDQERRADAHRLHRPTRQEQRIGIGEEAEQRAEAEDGEPRKQHGAPAPGIRGRPDDEIAQRQDRREQRNGQVDHDRVHAEEPLQVRQAWRVNGLGEGAEEGGRCNAGQNRCILRCDQDISRVQEFQRAASVAVSRSVLRMTAIARPDRIAQVAMPGANPGLGARPRIAHGSALERPGECRTGGEP